MLVYTTVQFWLISIHIQILNCLFRQTQKLEDQLKSFLDIASELEAEVATDSGHIEEASGLCFDISEYRTEKEVNIFITDMK